ncbi:NADP-dependent aldehyde dehydrogenase [Dyadobacter koreensis]|uniref:NADP-dependent aldehyde dehydrogenase n=2 Tax=Dyadobacter koreensis TaxID=408657 RepID=A0A1H7AM60_9BACT|nr:NADP-dependent aldehyde dehydrogenase [Dyadobacter koreensis]
MDISKEELDGIVQKAQKAFLIIKNFPLQKRIAFMRAVADEIEALGAELIQTAMAESHLPEGRLVGEKGRTIFQWRSYADAVERGDSLDASIDTANAERTPPKPDIRKTVVPLGPVTVFGASNFPFAFSTAGGDTASAIAAGCPVIVKAHEGHPKTSGIMADAISRAVEKSGMPEGTFAHVYSSTFETGQQLVSHPLMKAVGFTGSYRGGKALMDLANQRQEPIPVFAEMGSVNPLYLLPNKIKSAPQELAKQYAGSLTLGVGQFCTNPGLVIGVAGKDLDQFIEALKQEIAGIAPSSMLNEKIANGYAESREKIIGQSGVEVLAVSATEAAKGQGLPTVATVAGVELLVNPALLHEVFGPFALIVQCKDASELVAVTEKLEGQLTVSLFATNEDLSENTEVLSILQTKCGRILFNNFPTGVEVCKSMHHGGPFPSSSNGAYTSVGADSIKRFVRPLSFQNWPDEFLPDELKSSNPLNIWRTVNNERTKEAVG